MWYFSFGQMRTALGLIRDIKRFYLLPYLELEARPVSEPRLRKSLVVKARVRGGWAMCISAFSGCGAGAPRRKFWGYVITFN